MENAAKLKVYLSSPFMEFEEIRKKFLDEIKARAYLYEINAMEFYRAEDKNVLAKCKEDVNKCDIYVCILGSAYGSLAIDENKNPTDKSYTHWEYITACERKDRNETIERIILLQRDPVEDPKLKQWQDDIKATQILPAYYKQQDEIPRIILESLDLYTQKVVQAAMKKKDVMEEKIYLCDRSPQNLGFANGLDEDTVQFFLLTGHDKDLPHYFIRRKEIEYEEMETQWKNIDITPPIPNDANDFNKVQSCIMGDMFNKLKWKKFKTPKDVTGDNLITYMTENNYDYLSISWFIESVYWKNDKLREFIVRFYKEFSEKYKKLPTTKRIFFFGIITYVDNPELSEEEFNNRIKDIVWENNLPKFEKIKKKEVKDWLSESEIEKLDYPCEQLISVYLKDIHERDMFFSELEGGLLNIIKLYKQEHFK